MSSNGINNMLKFIKDNFYWVKDIAIILFMVAVLYLNSHFVTVEQFKTSEAANLLAHTSIQTTLVSVDKTLALMQQNQTTLSEHEIQIKTLEKTMASFDTKIKLIESMDQSSQIKINTFKLFDLEARIKLIESHSNSK
jgi:uncharacterized membrane protein